MKACSNRTDMSRRSFLGGAALVGAAAAAGLASNLPASQAFAAENVSATDEGASKIDFAIAPVNVAEAGEPIRECDYLVIGGGNCGMMSAAHAGQLGLSTIVLEKSGTTGGSSVGTEVTMGFSDCKIMQECPSDPDVIDMSQQTGTPDEIFRYFMMHNSWKANAQLVRNFIDTNHRYHDFLYEHGGYPMMLLPSLDAPTGGIMYQGQGIGAFEVMQAAAEQYGVEILTNTPATALVVDDNGAVVGAMAEVDGAEGYVKAKAVFVGTGGFSTNPEMVSYYIGQHGEIASKGDAHLAHDGDGIRMMFGVGAAASDMGFAQPAASAVEGVVWSSPVDKAAREPYLWVNNVGARLGNEKWTVMDTTFKVGIKEKDAVYYNVIDTAAVRRMETEPFLTSARTVLGEMDPIPTMTDELEAAVSEGLVFKGDTLEALAEAAGIDAPALVATVERYNELANAGEDTDFFKDPAALFPIEEGPFYAFKLIPAWYSTLCGVKINGNIEAVDADSRAIPGLYAGGLDSGEFFKDDYAHGFSGSCSGYSYFTGFFAAEKAQEYIESL